MKTFLQILAGIALAVLLIDGVPFHIVVGIIVLVLIAIVVLGIYFEPSQDERMKQKWGEDYKTLISNGELSEVKAHTCQPTEEYTDIELINKKIYNLTGVKGLLPTYTILECKETLSYFNGDYFGKAEINKASAT